MLSTFYFFIVAIALFHTKNVSAQSYWNTEPHQVRKLINEKIFTINAETPQVKEVKDITIKSGDRTTPLRIYTPDKLENLPIILLIHGGAWVAGNLDTHDNMARYLCREVQALVVSVGYLNAPEGKFPLPLEQCYDALLWTVEHAQEFHANPQHLAVVGDSAGGNMAAVLCLMARDRKGPHIALQVLINPAPDLRMEETARQGSALAILHWIATQYVKDPKDLSNPYVSPIVAEDLSKLPPAVIILAENDELRKDGQKYADRLISAGIPTKVYIQPGIGHLAGDGARAATLARPSLDETAAALRESFN